MFDRDTDAFIENHCCTTSGIHKNCPDRRHVGGTSIYVCCCRTPAVNAARGKVPGYTAPTPLPVIDAAAEPPAEPVLLVVIDLGKPR